MKTRKIGSFLGLGAFALLGAPTLFGVAHAQETLAGLGAASGIGATLGATAATTFNTSRVPRGFGTQNELIDEAGNAGGPPGMPGTGGAATAPAVITPPPVQSYGLNMAETIRELQRNDTVKPDSGGLKRRKESKVSRQRRLARLSPAARKREIQKAYKIPPRGWLATYLPQDRYKLGKVWQYVSTEDSNYYYTPQALAARKFNPNRVIGFRDWQDAMLAGYKPDPVSKPEPAPDILALSYSGAKPQVMKYAEYLYSGQMSPATHRANMRYLSAVVKKVYANADVRDQIPVVTTQILGAAIGSNGVPTQVATKEYWIRNAIMTAAAQQKAENDILTLQALALMGSSRGFGGAARVRPWWDFLGTGLFDSKVIF